MRIYVIKGYRVLILDVMSVQESKFIPQYDIFSSFLFSFILSLFFYIFKLDL